MCSAGVFASPRLPARYVRGAPGSEGGVGSKGYTGQWRGGARHGQGVYRYSGGGSYAGQWQQGYKHGQGVRVFPNGDLYDGDYKDGHRHGKGVEICAGGMRYDGQWKGDKMHGMPLRCRPLGRCQTSGRS